MTTETGFKGLLPCPFCGYKMTDEDETLVPMGLYWKADPSTNYRKYFFSHSEVNAAIDNGAKLSDFNPYIEARCDTLSGGCGACVTGASVEDAIAKWNRRV